jgi:hypothetical protein
MQKSVAIVTALIVTLVAVAWAAQEKPQATKTVLTGTN